MDLLWQHFAFDNVGYAGLSHINRHGTDQGPELLRDDNASSVWIDSKFRYAVHQTHLQDIETQVGQMRLRQKASSDDAFAGSCCPTNHQKHSAILSLLRRSKPEHVLRQSTW